MLEIADALTKLGVTGPAALSDCASLEYVAVRIGNYEKEYRRCATTK